MTHESKWLERMTVREDLSGLGEAARLSNNHIQSHHQQDCDPSLGDGSADRRHLPTDPSLSPNTHTMMERANSGLHTVPWHRHTYTLNK